MSEQSPLHVVGALRIKNESSWICEVLRSWLPVCERIFIFDDHSTDGTPELIERESLPGGQLDSRVIVTRSNFVGINESKDKQFLIDVVMNSVFYRDDANGGTHWPDVLVTPDGDELLDQRDIPLLLSLFLDKSTIAWRARILYLWNSRSQVRVDGVYRNFNRPTFWRMINVGFKYQSTPWGKDPDTGLPVNFHCSSIPQELLYKAVETNVRILHLGYMNKEDRIRKWKFYNRIDPNNVGEDCYRHCVAGDVPEVPADARLKHAGPLEIVPLDSL